MYSMSFYSSRIATFAITNSTTTIYGYISPYNSQYYAYFDSPIDYYIIFDNKEGISTAVTVTNSNSTKIQYGSYYSTAIPYGSNGVSGSISLIFSSYQDNSVYITGTISLYTQSTNDVTLDNDNIITTNKIYDILNFLDPNDSLLNKEKKGKIAPLASSIINDSKKIVDIIIDKDKNI